MESTTYTMATDKLRELGESLMAPVRGGYENFSSRVDGLKTGMREYLDSMDITRRNLTEGGMYCTVGGLLVNGIVTYYHGFNPYQAGESIWQLLNAAAVPYSVFGPIFLLVGLFGKNSPKPPQRKMDDYA